MYFSGRFLSHITDNNPISTNNNSNGNRDSIIQKDRIQIPLGELKTSIGSS